MQKEQKKSVIKKFQSHVKDTGSSEVQIALLTEKIINLSEHLKAHHKDNHSRKGLIGMVGQRRKLLQYLRMTNLKSYMEVTQSLGLRK